MTKIELITTIADKAGTTKIDAANVLVALAHTAQVALRETGEFSIPSIGKLKVSERAARTARNPKTGATVSVPASKKLKLVTASTLKAAIQ